ncbi:MAG TPA: serine hydrolase [Thermoanaerobaculia bacterium]|nr:serine hydrolase [Thermoanaerobaculia bacterium]
MMNERPLRLAASLLTAVVLAWAVPVLPASAATAASPAASATAETADRLLAESYPAGEPGAAVLVEQGGRIVLRKGYGLANLEHGIPVTPETVFEVGSVTKQFTAAAILMLQERGKLSLSDDLTKFLPDYPIQGKKVTIENLLTHTSGIPSYTGLPEWLPRMREDMTLDQLIGLFKDKPFEFEPGTKWAYDNSGYVLLGAVIEKASGKSYERFVEDEIFQPLAMSHSLYGSVSDIVPHRAAGYDKSGDHWVNTPYLSMTQPYAAGSLMSTVDDLAVWGKALAGETLLKKDSVARMATPYRLPSGLSTRYGYGLGIHDLGGKAVVEHGGGINGFTCDLLRIPSEGIFIAVLTNNTAPKLAPEAVAERIAKTLLGLPAERQAIQVDPKILDDYVGVYRNEDATRTVTREGDKLYAQRQGGERQELAASARDDFFYKGAGATIRFVRDAQGKVTGANVDTQGPEELPMKRISEAPPAAKQAIEIAPAILAAYVGTYELAPSFQLTITLEDSHLHAQATGQHKLELFAESETKFFLKEVDAQVEFQRDAGGAVTGLVLHQGGRDMPGKRK